MWWLIVSLLAVPASAQWSPNCASGRTTIVHLFEWRWADIAAECERFLGPYGYCGVQVSPPNEHRVIWDRPWYERYQPVSYKLISRSGNENEFRNMVERCNNAGVRIYVDAVVNHMAAGGSGYGTAGSEWNGDALYFPGVPFSSWDFNPCEMCGTHNCEINNYNDVNQVRNCRLVGLRDLRLAQDYVRQKVADYMNSVISMGVAGFRLDAAKHMWPGDMQAFLGRLQNLNTRWFPRGARPFIYSEVIDLGGEPIRNEEYTFLGTVTEFKYGKNLGDVVRKNSGQRLSYLRSWGQGWGMLHTNNALVFVDNHDNQRGHGAGGFGSILTFFEPRMYKIANAFMLAHPYGHARVMSSYRWDRRIVNGKDQNDGRGPPSDGNGNTLPVPINGDMTCGNGWVCEHRWRQIYSMAQFRNAALGSSLTNWWDNGSNQIAFARQNKAFIAINNDNFGMNQWLATTLPSGNYCDVISGGKSGGRCTGKTINVNNDGWTQVIISNGEEDPMVAIHINSKL